MSHLVDFAKSFLIIFGSFWVIFIMEFIYLRQTTTAFLLLVPLIIMFSGISLDYLRTRKTEKT
jgi:hypothetical protein